MPLAVTISKHWSDGKVLHAVGTLTASGSYSTGGDAITFPEEIKSSTILFVEVHGEGVYQYRHDPSAGTVKVIDSGSAAELSAGAYPGGVTGDTISFHAMFRKFI